MKSSFDKGLYLLETDTGNGQNIIVIEKREQIVELSIDLDSKKELARVCHSLIIIPASLIPARLCQSNINRAFSRLLHIRRVLDCKIIIVVEPDDVLEKRIAQQITQEQIC
jgi:hypothetical protein